jgi:zinc transporter ZupT
MSKWLVRGVVIGILLLFVSRGGGAALGPLMKFAVPLAAGYFIYRGLRSVFRPTLEHQGHAQARGDKPQTIEICPACGSQKERGHRC